MPLPKCNRSALPTWLVALTAAAIAGCSEDGKEPDDPAVAGSDAFDPITVDLVDAACHEPGWKAPAMAIPLVTFATATDYSHELPPTPLSYDVHPPSSGAHRPAWAKWGRYSYLPPQRWLHNLEHGGIALLYHPCLADEDIQSFIAWARRYKPRDGRSFLWVMSPYPKLPAAIAAVAWEWTMLAGDVTETGLAEFTESHHRQGPEDNGMNGPYDLLWIEK